MMRGRRIRGVDIEAFPDRAEAGRLLTARVADVVEGPCVVAAIPRGGVAVAMPIVERLAAPLVVIYARKLTARVAPELAFGALDEDGECILDRDTVEDLSLSPADVEEAKRRVGAEIRRRMSLYAVPPLAHYLPDRSVVLVDDGLATGLTMRAAVEYARRHGARKIIVAVPCAAVEAAQYFERVADRLVSLIVDPGFMAVGAYYLDFSPVTDDAVVAMLRSAERTGAGRPEGPARRIAFRNARGLQLAGELLLPAAKGPHPVVVFAHGWGSGKDSPRNRAVAEALQARGIAAFLFDFTGHGESEGTPEESTPDQQVDDLRAAVDHLRALGDVDASRAGIVGASSGAAVALAFAADRPGVVRALSLRSGNVEGAEAAASRVTAPTLLVVGEQDTPIRAMNEDVLRRLRGPRQLEIVPKGDHLFEDPEARRQATALMVAWLARHLELATQDREAS